MRKIVIICLATIPLWTSACSGQTKHSDMKTIQNDTTYIVKHSDIKTIQNDSDYFIWRNGGMMLTVPMRIEFYVNNKLIAQLPVPVKTIIARYTAFLPNLDKKIELKFAKALGGFSTLEEARQVLLKDWTGADLVFSSCYLAADFRMEETKESLIFKYFANSGEKITDEFKIDESGHITYIKQPESIKKIPYNRKTILGNYLNYCILLNDKPDEVDDCLGFPYLYLDPDNIKSVGVNERYNIVYIEQKNKNPKYFVRSDLVQYFDSLKAFKIKSLDAIPIINIYDGRDYNEFDSNCKIEVSNIKIISSNIDYPSEHNLKWVSIVLKKEDNE